MGCPFSRLLLFVTSSRRPGTLSGSPTRHPPQLAIPLNHAEKRSIGTNTRLQIRHPLGLAGPGVHICMLEQSLFYEISRSPSSYPGVGCSRGVASNNNDAGAGNNSSARMVQYQTAVGHRERYNMNSHRQQNVHRRTLSSAVPEPQAQLPRPRDEFLSPSWNGRNQTQHNPPPWHCHSK